MLIQEVLKCINCSMLLLQYGAMIRAHHEQLKDGKGSWVGGQLFSIPICGI